MKKLLFVFIIPILLLSGCDFHRSQETEAGNVPRHIVYDQKNYLDFNVTVAFEDRIYCITDDIVDESAVERKIGSIRRDVTSHALINGDYGFYTLKKDKQRKFNIDNTMQNLFNMYNGMKVSGNGVYKVKYTNVAEEIALQYKDNHYRKFKFIGEMNSFYKSVEVLLKPIVFVPLLVVIFVLFLICILFFD